MTGAVTTLTQNDLPEGEVLIKVQYSGLNYKDAMANMPNSPIVNQYPFIPGIDLAGEVVESVDDRFEAGDLVIVTSYALGVSHDGGYSEYARVKAEWVIPLPQGLSLAQAMLLGTAGLTAAMSVAQLQQQGIEPNSGPILVTGASGGVGSIATALLANLGYEVEASSGKQASHSYLTTLGASAVMTREDVVGEKVRLIDKQQWVGAVDSVGGETLAAVLSKLKYNGVVAASGLTGGIEIPTSVYPFILRGISLIGIDSVYCPMETRKSIWLRLGSDMRLSDEQFKQITNRVISLEELSSNLPTLLEGQSLGRVLVKI